jgi:stage V sporulation protein G
MSKDLNMDVRVYPIDAPKGNTVAFASVTFCAGDEPVNAINSIRVVDSAKGAFVSLPQTQDKHGEYHDVAFPVVKGLRGNMSKAILAELDATMKSPDRAKEPHMHLGGRLPENGTGEVSVEANVTPIRNPRGNTVAFGSVTFKIDDKPFNVIDNVRVVNSAENGLFVTMPQSQDKDGAYHDIAFPVMKGLRNQVTDAVLAKYEQALDERAADKGAHFSERIAAGKEKSEEYKQARQAEPAMAAAKKAPGLGD